MSGQGRLYHKRVIITGAASGIGEASARLYAAEGASAGKALGESGVVWSDIIR